MPPFSRRTFVHSAGALALLAPQAAAAKSPVDETGFVSIGGLEQWVAIQGQDAENAAILYLHWYEPPKPSSNRTEFLAEAIELASLGTTSLLIDTPWRVEGWLASRDGSKDYDFSVHEAKEVRRALDVLLAQPSIDPTRVAIVGHDFGAMYGALAAAADRRVTHMVYMAGNGSMGE